MKQKEFNDFLPYGNPKLEATKGRKSKASKLQWLRLIYGLCYFIFFATSSIRLPTRKSETSSVPCCLSLQCFF